MSNINEPAASAGDYHSAYADGYDAGMEEGIGHFVWYIKNHEPIYNKQADEMLAHFKKWQAENDPQARAALPVEPATSAGGGVGEREAFERWCFNETQARAALATPSQAPAVPVEQQAPAWLVEWKAHGYGPQWWGFNYGPGKYADWCSDANNAIRFARRKDAERMRLHIIAVAGLTGRHDYERAISVTEHEWPAPASPEQQAGECERCGLPPSEHTAAHWCDNQSFALPAAPSQPQPAVEQELAEVKERIEHKLAAFGTHDPTINPELLAEAQKTLAAVEKQAVEAGAVGTLSIRAMGRTVDWHWKEDFKSNVMKLPAGEYPVYVVPEEERKREFYTGICVALTVLHGSDSATDWGELVRTCGPDLIYHAAHVEPEEWTMAGFKKYLWSELHKRKPRARIPAPVGIPGEGGE